MNMSEKETSSSLKMANKTLNGILTKGYGMKEDLSYVVPLKPTRNRVNILELKRDRQKT